MGGQTYFAFLRGWGDRKQGGKRVMVTVGCWCEKTKVCPTIPHPPTHPTHKRSKYHALAMRQPCTNSRTQSRGGFLVQAGHTKLARTRTHDHARARTQARTQQIVLGRKISFASPRGSQWQMQQIAVGQQTPFPWGSQWPKCIKWRWGGKPPVLPLGFLVAQMH